MTWGIRLDSSKKPSSTRSVLKSSFDELSCVHVLQCRTLEVSPGHASVDPVYLAEIKHALETDTWDNPALEMEELHEIQDLQSDIGGLADKLEKKSALALARYDHDVDSWSWTEPPLTAFLDKYDMCSDVFVRDAIKQMVHENVREKRLLLHKGALPQENGKLETIRHALHIETLHVDVDDLYDAYDLQSDIADLAHQLEQKAHDNDDDDDGGMVRTVSHQMAASLDEDIKRVRQAFHDMVTSRIMKHFSHMYDVCVNQVRLPFGRQFAPCNRRHGHVTYHIMKHN